MHAMDIPGRELIEVDADVRLAAWRWGQAPRRPRLDEERGERKADQSGRHGAPALTGRPFVLVHGLASNAHLWDGVAHHLGAGGHPSVAIDLRGHGQSDKPDGDGAYAIERVAADVAALIEHLGLERPILVGQSYGGNVVLQVAADHPELVDGVACVDGGFFDLRRRMPLWEEAAEVMAPPRLIGRPLVQLEDGMRAMHPDWPDEGIAGALACFEVRDDGTVAPWLTFERHLEVLHGMWSQDTDRVWSTVTAPVLLIAARTEGADEWNHTKEVEVERCAAALPTSKEVFMDGDHDLHAQHPAAIAGLLAGLVQDGWWA